MNNTMTDATEHRAAWNQRWADAYATDAERDAAYCEHQRQLATMRAVFGIE
ncbi:hypothetical protein M1247_07110 [Mycobacterium sp. 21AC1]|uniref:hypothetical protein n=1 Tax=[Mycobacterium] appelbergii TaxID=2939269 RepID=UPI00293936BC|nr:hypothetical protein [Mycobacterium sp. 21AC1]MDV3124677.1 hypothetical protein [Mycobacterium sp. 21AC1]